MCTLTVLMKDQFTFVQFCYFAARCFYEQYPVLWSQWLPPLPTVASGLFFKKAFLIESQIVVAILFFICKFLKLFIVSLPCSLDLTWRRTYPGVAWCTSLFKKEIRHCFFTVFFHFFTLLFHRRYHYVMQPRAFGDIFSFPVPVATSTDENIPQAKLAETSVLFSNFYNSSTNTFEINI